MANQRLSIITINLNNLEGLKNTFKSIINQTWVDFEYIIIDGGSIDGSAEYIESQNKNIDYWVSESDTGIYNAMNKGIKKAKGEYILFINSGDVLYSNTVLEENFREIHMEDLIYFNLCQVYENRTTICSYPEALTDKTFLGGTIGHPSTLIKKSLFYKYGFYDESLSIVSDWKFFFLLVVKYNVSRRKVNKTLSKFYYDGISTLNPSLNSLERNFVLESEFNDYVRLDTLERLLVTFKKSRLLKCLNRIGFLNYIKKYY